MYSDQSFMINTGIIQLSYSVIMAKSVYGSLYITPTESENAHILINIIFLGIASVFSELSGKGIQNEGNKTRTSVHQASHCGIPFAFVLASLKVPLRDRKRCLLQFCLPYLRARGYIFSLRAFSPLPTNWKLKRVCLLLNTSIDNKNTELRE